MSNGSGKHFMELGFSAMELPHINATGGWSSKAAGETKRERVPNFRLHFQPRDRNLLQNSATTSITIK
jgi:hypothetical protein